MGNGWYSLLAAIVATAAADYHSARPDSREYTTAAQFLDAAGLLGCAHMLPRRGTAIAKSGGRR